MTADAILERFHDLGQSSFERRVKRLESALTDCGPIGVRCEGTARTDPLPVVISADEWRMLSSGLAQRTRMFDALALDLYGEQKLWKKGILPASLLYSNPDFQQVAWNVKPVGGHFVHLSACDVIHGPDGAFRVVGDRLQVPEALGRALENRLGVSRAFPELFRSMNTERLAGFFARLLETLASLRAPGKQDALSVLLASGAGSATRDEDAILSRYLGLPLVENDDLAVRRMEVYLKTLGGLKPISAILRRVPDAMCDPLELCVDSGEGAVGLISSLRAGKVGLMNFLGTGALETGLFKPFMPALFRELLGEDQLLPDVRTVWLGDRNALDEVMSNPEAWYFRKTFGDRTLTRYDRLTPTGQLALLRKIETAPDGWTAEASVPLSRQPIWTGTEWVEAEVKCRFYALNAKDGTMVMPGGYGMYQVREQPGLPVREGEKDVWVLSDGPVTSLSLLASADEPIEPTRAGGDLPSRVAETLSSLGHALVAVQMQACLARSVATRLADESWTDFPELPALLTAIAQEDPNPMEVGDPEAAIRNFVLRKDYRYGIQAHIRTIRELAQTVRDRVSEELWSQLQNFAAVDLPEDSAAAALLPYLARILADSAAVAGLCAESMTRGYEWRFLEIGQRLERARRTIRLVRLLAGRAAATPSAEASCVASLLEVGDGAMTYRRRYGGRLQILPALDLLLCDESNPRSAAYQVARLEKESKRLPQQNKAEALYSPLDRLILRLVSDLRLADLGALSRSGLEGRRDELQAFLSAAESTVGLVRENIARAYLNHAPRTGVVHALVTEV